MAFDRYGIDDSYYDAQGVEHLTSPETRAALLAAMGVEAGGPPVAGSAETAVRVLTPGGAGAHGVDRSLTGPAELQLEDGTTVWPRSRKNSRKARRTSAALM